MSFLPSLSCEAAADLFGNSSAQFLAKCVCLFKQFLADLVKVDFLVAFNFGIDLIFKIVVKIYCFIDYLGYFFRVFMRIESDEQCAVVNEFPDDVLDVLFYVSKIHNKNVIS